MCRFFIGIKRETCADNGEYPQKEMPNDDQSAYARIS